MKLNKLSFREMIKFTLKMKFSRCKGTIYEKFFFQNEMLINYLVLLKEEMINVFNIQNYFYENTTSTFDIFVLPENYLVMLSTIKGHKNNFDTIKNSLLDKFEKYKLTNTKFKNKTNLFIKDNFYFNITVNKHGI